MFKKLFNTYKDIIAHFYIYLHWIDDINLGFIWLAFLAFLRLFVSLGKLWSPIIPGMLRMLARGRHGSSCMVKQVVHFIPL